MRAAAARAPKACVHTHSTHTRLLSSPTRLLPLRRTARAQCSASATLARALSATQAYGKEAGASPACFLPLPAAATCCHHLPHLLPPLALRKLSPEFAWVWRSSWRKILSNQTLASVVVLWCTKPCLCHTWRKPLGLAP